MVSTFFGLNTALQGLYGARIGLDVTNHNISNAETRGYSRQVVAQRASGPIALNNGKGMIGSGVEVYAVNQIRNSYIDRRYWNSSSILGEYSVKSQTLSQIEAVFDATSDTSFNKVMEKYFNSIQDLSTNPSDLAYREVLKQNSLSFTQYFNEVSTKLTNYQKDLNFNIESTVKQINSYASQIQSLNQQIYNSEIDGNVANDLRDRRAVLVDDLSKLVNVEVKETDRKEFRVELNGQLLVDHLDVKPLEVRERDISQIQTEANFRSNKEISGNYGITNTSTAADVTAAFQQYQADCKKYNQTNTGPLYDIYWKDMDVKLDVTDPALRGQLKGYITLRDGNNGAGGKTGIDDSVNFKGIPHYLEQINHFARTFAKLMNEGISYNGTQLTQNGGFANGFNLNGGTGVGLFSYKDVNGNAFSGQIPGLDYSDITASNFNVSSEILSDVKNLATTFDPNADKSNNNLLLQIVGLKHNNNAFSQGEIGDFMTSVIAELAIDTSQAEDFEKNQENITMSIENQRLSVSGVSLNEEMANMVKYQQIYMAAAKMITTMDEIYNTTINKLGAT